MLKIEAFFDPATSTVSYLVWDAQNLDAAIIDPVLDYEPNAARLTSDSVDKILDLAAAKGLKIVWALDTHIHADHLSATDHVRKKTGAKIGIGARIVDVQKTFTPIFCETEATLDKSVFDVLFEDQDIFKIGTLNVTVKYTPGHTPACVTYLIEDAAFVGDTMFMPDYGTARADFPGGDAATLYRSIQDILNLPSQTRIFVGHDYLPKGRDNYVWETTVAEQRAHNIHVHEGISEAAFVEMRTARDATLGLPRLILPSLQVNIRAGALPPSQSDGHTYLKIPINRL